MSLPPFERVVAEHGATVLRVCRALLPLHEAEDAAAETLLAALAAYPRLRTDSDLRAWLVTIAHRKSVDALRSAQRRALPLASPPEPRTAGPGPEPRDDRLWAAVRALPDKQRRAVAYHYLGGLPYREIAGLLGSSEAAARRSAADGIGRLRKDYLTDQITPTGRPPGVGPRGGRSQEERGAAPGQREGER